jgi:hypothetical protein
MELVTGVPNDVTAAKLPYFSDLCCNIARLYILHFI